MLTIRALKNGKGYAGRHLEYSDYVDENAKVTGYWFGKAAEKLGLSGEVTKEQFENLRKGLSPDGTQKLRLRFNRSDKRRTMFDCVLSAPKSVSAQALPGGDARLINAHDQAVLETLAEVEALAGTRVRTDGRNEDRITGNLAIAIYRHHAGRALQCQLHSHAVAFNLTFDNAENRWKALQARGIYDAASFLTEVYRAKLARLVQEMGYEIERNIDGAGKDLGWELKAVAPEIRAAYSESKSKEAAIQQFIEREGRKPSKNEVAVLVRGIREKKLKEISTAEVHRIQRERITPEQLRSLQDNRARALARGSVLEPGSPVDSLQYAKDHLFFRQSVVKDYRVLEEVLKHGGGKVSLEEARTEMRVQQATQEIFGRNGNVATRESLQRESFMIETVNRGMGQFERLGRKDFTPDAKLSAEQRLAVETLLNSRDLAICLEGAAGTGKTFTLQEVRRGLHEAGRPFASLAPTRSAVKELEKVGFGDAMTIESLLGNPEKQAALRGHAVIVDEAGMVSSPDMARLLQSAQQFQYRLLLVGDTKQIRSVREGDGLRILLKESRLQKASLVEVWRQRETAMGGLYRPTMEMLRDQPHNAFELLEAMNAVELVKYNQRPDRTVEAVLAEKRVKNADGQYRSVLAVFSTHEEIHRYNEAIRDRLKAEGQLQGAKEFTRLEPLNFTDAQKREPDSYRPGMVLVFHNAVKNAAVGDRCTVTGTHKGNILTRNRDGQVVAFTKKQALSFSVFAEQKIEIAPGDQILFQANRKLPDGRDITNGDVAVAHKIDAKNRLHLQDGRVVPLNFAQFTYGYASTAHRSQGGTVDSVVVSADRMDRELFYVACSRGRERVQVFTSDIGLLRESVTWDTARTSATELAREEPPEEAAPVRRQRSVWSQAVLWARRQARTWQQRLFDLGQQREFAVPQAHQLHAVGRDRSSVFAR
jgi:conjugative relaxase-like TrwC/TraI family protein